MTTNITVCNATRSVLFIRHFLRRITATHYLNYRTAQGTGVNATVQASLTRSVHSVMLANAGYVI